MARIALFFEDDTVNGAAVVKLRVGITARNEDEAKGLMTPACAYGLAAAASAEEPEVVKAILEKVTQQSGMTFPDPLPALVTLDGK